MPEKLLAVAATTGAVPGAMFSGAACAGIYWAGGTFDAEIKPESTLSRLKTTDPCLTLSPKTFGSAARWAGSPAWRLPHSQAPGIFLPALQQHQTRQQGEQDARLQISSVSLQRCLFAKSRYLLPSSYKEGIGNYPQSKLPWLFSLARTVGVIIASSE